MKTEVYIEDYLLDQTSDLSSLLTFAIDDIKNFSSRTTAFSKTIILPGTANNNKLLGNIFQVGQSNPYDSAQPNVGFNFNAAKSANCIIFQDNIQTFKGVLRLLEIDVTAGRYEYQVAVFGDISYLNTAIGAALLEDLDFSEYDQSYTIDGIVNSWDNVPGAGVYYPLIDYGTYSIGKHDWDYHTFRPALYAKQYIDKMFAAAGFRYQSAIFDSARFKTIVVPYAAKVLTTNTSLLLTASESGDHVVIDYSGSASNPLPFDVTDSSIFAFTGSPPVQFTYIGTDPVFIKFAFDLEYTWKTTGNTIRLSVWKNGGEIFGKTLGNTGGVTVPGFWDETIDISLVNGDFLNFQVTVSDSSFGHPYTFTLLSTSVLTIKTTSDVPVPVNIGDDLKINDVIPRNIKQLDFLVSIVKLFNLYVYEDKFEKNLIYITPYIDFYGTDNTDSLDWSYKLNRDKKIAIKPMSEITSKVYNFKFTSDEDYYNDLYTKRYNQNYGDYIFTSDFEFTTDSNDVELIFSSTVLVGYAGEDKIQGTIFKLSGSTEENVDSNIRLMQTKKVETVSSWDIKDGVTVLTSLTDYGYAGHFDDPGSPTNDLNFGALQEIFFILDTAFLSNTQFNLYWSAYMAEITDKDSKLMSGSFYLKPSDIFALDFSKFIYVDGVLYRLNKITDYNLSTPSDCKVDLLKVNFTLY